MKDITRTIDRDSHRTRILVLLPKTDVPPESLSLFATLLSLFPKVDCKGRYQALSALSFSFRPVYLLGHVALLAFSDQVEDPNLTFLFKDPYKEADHLLLGLLKEGALLDEKRLDQAKRQLLSKPWNSKDILSSRLCLPFAEVFFDRRKIVSLSAKDVEKVLSSFQDLQGVLSLYVGSAKRNAPLPLPSLSGTEKEPEGTSFVLEGMKDESLALLFSHAPITDGEDYFSLLSAISSFEGACSLYFRRMMLSPLSYSFYPISSERSALLLTFDSNNLTLLSRQLPFVKGEKVPFLYERTRRDDWLLRKKELELLMDRKERLNTLLSFALLGLDDKDLLGEHDFSKAEAIYESMTIEDIVLATGGRK